MITTLAQTIILMTDDEKREAIAKACGWPQPNYAPGVIWMPKDGGRVEVDPLSDLNVMHEAEKAVFGAPTETSELWHEYFISLENVTWKDEVPQGSNRYYPITRLISATAAQRAEAFLRTINPAAPTS